MYMIKKRVIFILSLLLLASCTNVTETETIEEQQEDIVSFLTGSHSPTLIWEGDVAESIYDEPEFYTTYGNTAYRYIEDYYSEERDGKSIAYEGSTVELTFWCYDFSTYSKPSDSYLYFTNDPAYEVPLQEAGLNTEYWSFEPLTIVLGKGDILKAIEASLVGCKEGDSVEIYMTYNMAYGSDWIGLSSLESPIAFFCTIDSVVN